MKSEYKLLNLFPFNRVKNLLNKRISNTTLLFIVKVSRVVRINVNHRIIDLHTYTTLRSVSRRIYFSKQLG